MLGKIGILLLLSGFLSSGAADVSAAVIDQRNGALIAYWPDFIGKTIKFPLSRIYRSDRTAIGLFGRGWCNPIEMHIKMQNDGYVVLDNCVGGDAVYKLIDKTHAVLISQPTAHLHDVMENFGGIEKFLSSNNPRAVKSRLSLSYLDLRYDSERLAGFNKSTPGYFFSFNATGNVEEIRTRDGGETVLPIRDGRGDLTGYSIRQPGKDETDRVNFTFDSMRRVVSVRSVSGTLLASYSYNNAGNLSSVKNGWGNTYAFSYDENNRLKSVIYPNNIIYAYLYADSGALSVAGVKVQDKHSCASIIDRDETAGAVRSFLHFGCRDGRSTNQTILIHKTSIGGYESIMPIIDGQSEDPGKNFNLFCVDPFDCDDEIRGLFPLWCNCGGNN